MRFAGPLPTWQSCTCPPSPWSVRPRLMQFVTLSLRPPYHLTTLLTVESEPFMTDHIAPREKAALTYLKHVPLIETEYDPPPVMTVGVEHKPPPGTGVFVHVGVGVR